MLSKRGPTLRVESNSGEETRSAPQRLHLLYHEVRAGGSRYSYVTDAAMFEKHVDLYVRLRSSESGGLWPELTFDDGHISNLEVAAPILKSRGLSARFFITVGWTGTRPGYMGWPELRALQDAGQSIGAHGWSHKLLTHCDDRELQTELSDSRLALEDKLGTSITTMSLPGGRFNRRVLNACAKAGYTNVYTSIPRAESLPLGSTVGRFNILGDMQPEWLAQLLQPGSGVLAKLQRQYRMKEAAKSLLGDRLYEKLWALRNRQESKGDDNWSSVG
jgi:peptidoglycan/xylan/chitin deacetylase (PgdA/CDA1 family)